MTRFDTRCPEVARRETRSVVVGPGPGPLPAGQYAFIEYYCEDAGCDCRRVFIQVIGLERPGEVLASINFGWEREAFYRKRMAYDPEAPREIVRGSLDPINAQSELAAELLKLFQDVAADAVYRLRLKRHYEKFRSAQPGEAASRSQ